MASATSSDWAIRRMGLAASKLAMIVAAFQTVYIWVHYFATEKPDMEHLYGA